MPRSVIDAMFLKEDKKSKKMSEEVRLLKGDVKKLEERFTLLIEMFVDKEKYE